MSDVVREICDKKAALGSLAWLWMHELSHDVRLYSSEEASHNDYTPAEGQWTLTRDEMQELEDTLEIDEVM